jgi:SpoVK/Ycf46/Vps4 family AAA+-type ATPase
LCFLESVADVTERPLYTISSGELGTDPKAMEESLSIALQLATTWKAIVLIDEADVFLEQRSAKDLKRNGLVSSRKSPNQPFLLPINANYREIFLRLLEYYEGILFLTTNRIQSFDKAFKSRIHLAIKYHPLTPSARAKLWELFIRNTYPDSNLDWMDAACLERLGNVKLNGREIKNAFRTGHALAVHSGEEFNMSHIEMALEGIQNFEADFDDAQDESASEDDSQERGKKRRRRD